MSTVRIQMFVDGSFSTNKEGVGWGLAVCRSDREGHFLYRKNGLISDPALVKTRNAAGELQAAIAAAELAQSLGVPVDLYFDYEGIQKIIEGEWKLKSPLTRAYYSLMTPVYQKGLIHFHKVPAHTGIPGNEEADRLAKAALEGVFYDG